MDSIAIITETGELDEILRNHPEIRESLHHCRWLRMVWHDDVRKPEQVRDKIIVGEIPQRALSRAGRQDRYYQPHGEARGQDVEVNIER